MEQVAGFDEWNGGVSYVFMFIIMSIIIVLKASGLFILFLNPTRILVGVPLPESGEMYVMTKKKKKKGPTGDSSQVIF